MRFVTYNMPSLRLNIVIIEQPDTSSQLLSSPRLLSGFDLHVVLMMPSHDAPIAVRDRLART